MSTEPQSTSAVDAMIEELRSKAGPGPATQSYNAGVITRFRDSQSRNDTSMGDLLLLTTTGARSGLRRTTPLVYFSEGSRIFVIASKAGADTHPAWFHNLVANPNVTVEQVTGTYPAVAEVLHEHERTRIYDLAARARSDIAEYETLSRRTIPVVELRRI